MTSKSAADNDEDDRDSMFLSVARRTTCKSSSVPRDCEPLEFSKTCDVQTMSDDAGQCSASGGTSGCNLAAPDHQQQTDCTSADPAAQSTRKLTEFPTEAICESEPARRSSLQHVSGGIEDCLDTSLGRFFSRQRQTEFGFENELEDHVCDAKAAADNPAITVFRNSRVEAPTCSLKENDERSDVCVDEDSPTPQLSDVTWSTLVGDESSLERLSSETVEQKPPTLVPVDQDSGVSGSQPAHYSPSISRGDVNEEDRAAVRAWLSDPSMSRLFSNAVNALLLDIGLDCVSRFNRSVQRSGTRSNFWSQTSTHGNVDDQLPALNGDDRETGDNDVDANGPQTESSQRHVERTCCHCLLGFADPQSLQAHVDEAHSHQSSPVSSLADRLSEPGTAVQSSTAENLSTPTASGHVMSRGAVWDTLQDSMSSYYGRLSPDVLNLLSTVPPELMLPHVYPGGMLPPAVLMMMLASPFVGCPTSPMQNSIAAAAAAAALTDQHGTSLPSAPVQVPAEPSGIVDDSAAGPYHHQSKRARTRISDTQLAVLRARFDISGSPNDDKIVAIGSEIGLPAKVVKHWFRNTLFKERQRCKDSPYNFSVPPASDPVESTLCSSSTASAVVETGTSSVTTAGQSDDKDSERLDMRSNSSSTSMPGFEDREFCQPNSAQPTSTAGETLAVGATAYEGQPPYLPFECYFGVPPYPPTPEALPLLPVSGFIHTPSAVSPTLLACSVTSTSTAVASHHPVTTVQSRIGAGGGHGKRASRTHFSDEQVRALQEHFERNAYPRDDELESLSRRLGLSARVIVVWFQNARQKARRTYENHSTAVGSGPGAPTAGLNVSSGTGSKTDDVGPKYDCRSCGASFQRYYELIKHQRSHPGCGSIAASTSNTTKYCGALPDSTPSRHGRSHLRYDKIPQTDVAPATTPSGLYRLQNNYRRHHAQQPISETWYPPPPPVLENYVSAAVGPRTIHSGTQVVDAFPVQHALPRMFHTPHLPLVTPWNGSLVASTMDVVDAGRSSPNLLGRQQSELSNGLDDRKCEMKSSGEHGLPKKSVDTDHSHGGGQSTYDDGQRKHQSVGDWPITKHEPLNGESAQCHADYQRRDSTELKSAKLQQIVAPSSALATAVKFPGQQEVREILGSRQMLVASALSPYDLQGDVIRRSTNHELASYAPLFGQNTAACGDETPLDLSCQVKISHTRSNPDSGSVKDATVSPDWRTLDSDGSAVIPGGGGGPSVKSQQGSSSGECGSKRHRTHMSELQVRVMRAVYADHRTPSIGECATLGARIGLGRRVVQVWFQNARAKDKKRYITEGGGGAEDGVGVAAVDGGERSAATSGGQCRWCGATLAGDRCSVREHVFSAEHVAAVDRIVRADSERRGGTPGGRGSKRDHRRRLLHHRAPVAMSTMSTLSTSVMMSSALSTATTRSATGTALDSLAGCHGAHEVSLVSADHHHPPSCTTSSTSASSSTARQHHAASADSHAPAAVPASAESSSSSEPALSNGPCSIFSRYLVKFPPSNAGVVPFIYPGYTGLLPAGFAPSHLPITGGNGLHYGGGGTGRDQGPVDLPGHGYTIARPRLTGGGSAVSAGHAAQWTGQQSSQHVNVAP